MKVYIKDELAEDMPFEIRAMRKQNVLRLRHLDPQYTLTNDQIQNATVQNTNYSPQNFSAANRNMTLEQYQNTNK